MEVARWSPPREAALSIRYRGELVGIEEERRWAEVEAKLQQHYRGVLQGVN